MPCCIIHPPARQLAGIYLGIFYHIKKVNFQRVGQRDMAFPVLSQTKDRVEILRLQ